MTGTTNADGSGVGANRRRDLCALMIIGIALALPVWGLMRYQGPPMEEGFMLAFPDQILHGRFPHRDFLHLYGPGAIYVLAAVFAVFGVSLVSERLVGLLQHAGVAFGLFSLPRPFGRRVATASALVSILLLIGPGGLSAMAWNGALALGVCGLAAGTAAQRQPQERRPTGLLVAAGVLAGAALLYRPDMVIAITLGLGAIVWDLGSSRRKPLLIALVATLSLYIPHLLISGVGNSVRGMFIEPVFGLRGGRALPVPPSWSEIDGFLQRAGALRTEGWPLPMPALPHQITMWFWLVPISILVNVIAAWRLRQRCRGSDQAIALWPGALFGAALLPQSLQRPDTTHLAWVSGITFALMIPAVTSLLEEARPRFSSMTRFLVGSGLVVTIFIAVIPFYPARTYIDLAGQTLGRNRFGSPITNRGRTFYFGASETAAQAQQVADALRQRSRPGERLIVGPNDLSRTNYSDAFFYYLFPDLVPGTRYLEMDPGIANSEDSGLADELRANDWLILSSAMNRWREPNDSARPGSSEPNRVVRDQYCLVTDSGSFKLLRRCR